MAANIHTILARIAMGCAPVLAVLAGVGIWQAMRVLRLPADKDVFEIAAGTWGWTTGRNTCRNNPHTITFSADRRTMTLTHPDSVDDAVAGGAWVYDVLEHEPWRIRGAIRGEDRKTPAGQPVVWDLVLRGPNLYAWHRTDWPALMMTDLIRRCPVAAEAEDPDSLN